MLRVWVRNHAAMDYAVSRQTGERIKAVLREGRATMPYVYFSTLDGRDIVLNLTSVQAMSIGPSRATPGEEQHPIANHDNGEHRSSIKVVFAGRTEIMESDSPHAEQILDMFQALEASGFRGDEYLCLADRGGDRFFIGVQDFIYMETSSAFLRQAMFPAGRDDRGRQRGLD